MSDAAPASPAKKATKPKAAAKKAAKPSTHPPVKAMVTAAIKNLKDRKGSSLQAIKKYMTANYKCDVHKLASFIRKCLVKGVADGLFTQAKGTGAAGSFKLSDKGKAEKADAKPKKAKKPKSPKKAAAKPKKAKTPKKKAAAKPKKVKTPKKAAAKPKKAKTPAKKAAKPKAKKPAAKKAKK